MPKVLKLMAIVEPHPIQFIACFGCHTSELDRKIVDVMGNSVAVNWVAPKLPFSLLPVGPLAAAKSFMISILIDLESLALDVFDRRMFSVTFGCDPPLIHVQVPSSLAKSGLQFCPFFESEVVKLSEVINSHLLKLNGLRAFDAIEKRQVVFEFGLGTCWRHCR